MGGGGQWSQYAYKMFDYDALHFHTLSVKSFLKVIQLKLFNWNIEKNISTVPVQFFLYHMGYTINGFLQ